MTGAVGSATREPLARALEAAYAGIPEIFRPALAVDERIHALWWPLRAIDDGPLPRRLCHSLLVLLYQQSAATYGVVWHLCALAELGEGPASFRELFDASRQDPAQVAADLDDVGEGLADPRVERALVAATLAYCSRSAGGFELSPRIRRLLGAEAYAAWIDLVILARTWIEWLRAYPEISVDADPYLRVRFAALLARAPHLAEIVGPGAAAPSPRWKVDADAVQIGIIQLDLSGAVVLANAEAQRIFGRTSDELRGLTISDDHGPVIFEDGTTCPHDQVPVRRCLDTWLPQGPITLGSQRAGDGSILWATYTAAPLLDPRTGEATGVTVTVVDISERKRAEEALQVTEDRYRLLVDSSDQMIMLFSPAGIVLAANAIAAQYWQTPVATMIGKTIHALIPDEALADAYIARNHQVLTTGEGIEFEEMIDLGARMRWFATRLRPVRDQGGAVSAVQALIRDITLRRTAEIALREREERARHEALHDPLTRLPNRVLLMDRLEVEVIHQRRHDGYHFAVLCLDLDRFKNINDSLGHAVGDQLLIEFSRRLLECIGPEDTLARTGGDEFAILLKDLQEPTDALKVADRVLGILRTPFTVRGHAIYTPTSIGIALSSPGYERPDDLLRDADTAMYRAKSRGKNRYELFDKAMHAEAVELLVLENDLRRAVSRSEFRLYYQPVVDMKDGELSGFEALLRWMHPTRGVVSPGDFISLAEETGIIITIGEWVLKEACQQMQRWHQRYPLTPALTISVNLSGKQFAQPALIAKVLRETSLDPSTLKLEITESVIMEDPGAAGALLQELKGQQIQSYVDDFGTGYSSLSYLHRFPMSAVKIDRSFVTSIGPGGENSEIVRTIVNLAHNLGMKVIAEGVETEDQRRLLLSMGCEYGQGFHFSPPLERETAEALIATTLARRRREAGELGPD